MTGIENAEAVFPLSPIQEGMLFHSISDELSGVFVTQVCIELSGSLRPEALRLAWQRVLERHAALRTAFFWEGLDAPLQVVRQEVGLPWQELDWSGLDIRAETEKFLAFDRKQPFDLTDAPAMRIVLIRVDDDTWRMVWSFHHMIIDGWSANIVLRDLLEALGGKEAGGQSPSYAAFVDKALDPPHPQAVDFWRARLAHRDQPTPFADPFVRPSPGHGHVTLQLSQEMSDTLRAFARKTRVTLNTIVLGAWARLLATYSDDEEPLFGTTVTTRPQDIAGIEEAVGVYINTLPIAIPLDARPLSEWLQSIQTEQQSAQLHNLTSLTDIQRLSGIPSGTALFDSIVVFENHGAAEDAFAQALQNSGLTAELVAFVDQSNYPLALLAIPGEEFSFELVFDQSLFGTEFSNGILESLERILEGFVSGADVPATTLAVGPAPATLVDQVSVQKPLHLQMAAQPSEAPAIRSVGITVSYADLNLGAGRIAASLLSHGIGSGDFVGLFAPRSSDFVIGMFGILKSGAAFVPLDPNYPSGHNQAAADDVGLAAVVAAQGFAEEAARFGLRVFSTKQPNADVYPDADEPDHPVYVIHTSGSQGRRKGVSVSHDNIAFSTGARRAVYGNGPERFLLLSPPAFDSAMVGLFWTLSTGGTLILPDPGQERDVVSIAEVIDKEEVTHLLCIPSLYRLLLEFAPEGSLHSLRTVIVAGETCPPELVGEHMRALPDTRLFNEYGPTESSVWCLAAELRSEDAGGPAPIGKPIPGMSAYLFDRWGKPVPDAVPGELSVAGPGVAQGYLGLPDATAKVFQTDPYDPDRRMYKTSDLVVRRADGHHVYLARADDQIKLNGFRIEPGEIAGALCGHPEISEAHVVLQAAPHGHSPEDIAMLLAALDGEEAERLFNDVASMADSDISSALEKI